MAFSTIERGGVVQKWSPASVVVSVNECVQWLRGVAPPLTLGFFGDVGGYEFGVIGGIAWGGSDERA